MEAEAFGDVALGPVFGGVVKVDFAAVEEDGEVFDVVVYDFDVALALQGRDELLEQVGGGFAGLDEDVDVAGLVMVLEVVGDLVGEVVDGGVGSVLAPVAEGVAADGDDRDIGR